MPTRVQPDLPPEDSRSSREPQAGLRLKQTAARLRRYLLGRPRAKVSAHDVQTLGLLDWRKALFAEERSILRREPTGHNLVSFAELEAIMPDPSPNPFDLVYGSELISQIEKNLVAEEWPYWDALLAGERPRHVAARLGIDPKLASKKMKKLEAKVTSIIFGQSHSA